MLPRIAIACLIPPMLALGAVPGAAGDGGSAFVGGVVGGIVGSAIGNAIQNQQPRRTVIHEQRVYRAAPDYSYQREQNRQVQTALNYFGFPAGVADGVIGAGTRSAMADYQAYMGTPPNGYLSDYDRSFLLTSYQRAIAGGPQTAQLIASNGQGVRGLLIAYRQEQYGAPAQPVAPPAVAVVPQQPVVPVAAQPVLSQPVPSQPVPSLPVAAQPATVEAASAPVVQPAAAKSAMPSFIGAAAAPSMAAQCNKTSIATNAHGGLMQWKVGETLDAEQTLAEQFCLARTYAIDQGDSLAATVQGFSAAEIDQQCIAFAPTMRDFAASLPSAKPEIETADLRKFVVGTGVAPAQLSANARICLGVGYRTDNADVALASAMVLVGLGETSYAELVGEHLVYGYGTPTRIDTGLDWLETAVGALENGATPLVTTSSDERVSLLELALTMLSVGATKGTMVQDASAPAQPKPLALPVPASATVPAGPSN